MSRNLSEHRCSEGPASDELRCLIPGCLGTAAYAARLGVPWPRLPSIYCTACAYGIAKWIEAHWPAAHMEVEPL